MENRLSGERHNRVLIRLRQPMAVVPPLFAPIKALS